MRNLVAALVAAALVFVSLSLMTTLHFYRKRRRQTQEAELGRGRRIVVELPTDPDFTYFTEDDGHFYYGNTTIDKEEIVAARVLINGAPIAAAVSPRWKAIEQQPTSFEDHPEGIARDRWDVAIETRQGAVLVECGAIRERISQELARNIFDAVKQAISDHHSVSA